DETGVRVKFSLMPDESKLILANAANVGPDIAMGTQVNLAYNLALRDSVHDLTSFSDFDEFVEMYKQPGALMPFIHDEGIYGLPETQNFNIMFYRKDIFEAMDLELPNTWDEALTLLPDLQRFGMNFFIPLAYADSYKTTDTTVPFIYQFNGPLYEEDGLSTSIDSDRSIKAIELMTDLFTVYGLPMQVPSFYHQFRYGTMPIGIGDFGVYVQLSHAAPEIKNMWGIHLVPGIEQEDGSINRETTGVGHGMMILKNSEKKDDAWEFLKWWMQTDVQIEFEQTMTMTLGSEYMWNSANLEAFEHASWPEADKAVLLEQWEQLRNVPNSPSSYMLERELSNIWNKIVLSGEPVREAVDDSVLVINREMERKNYEFGYMDRYGNKIRSYPIPTLEWIVNKGYKDEE
ncbi:MAG: extracellular solute-binding protein, partial [Bacillota bacterium]